MTIASGSAAMAADLLTGLTADGECRHLQDGTLANRPANPIVGDVYVATGAQPHVLVALEADSWSMNHGVLYSNGAVVDAKGTGPTTILSFAPWSGCLNTGTVMNIFASGTFNNATGGSRRPTFTLIDVDGVTTFLTIQPTTIVTATSGAWRVEYQIVLTDSIVATMSGRLTIDDGDVMIRCKGASAVDVVDAYLSGFTWAVQVAWNTATTSCNKNLAYATVSR